VPARWLRPVLVVLMERFGVRVVSRSEGCACHERLRVSELMRTSEERGARVFNWLARGCASRWRVLFWARDLNEKVCPSEGYVGNSLLWKGEQRK
jgi:hypothetical protein